MTGTRLSRTKVQLNDQTTSAFHLGFAVCQSTPLEVSSIQKVKTTTKQNMAYNVKRDVALPGWPQILWDVIGGVNKLSLRKGNHTPVSIVIRVDRFSFDHANFNP